MIGYYIWGMYILLFNLKDLDKSNHYHATEHLLWLLGPKLLEYTKS